MAFPPRLRKVVGNLAVSALLLSVVFSHPAHAQVVGGTISGTISDKSGALVPNATVSLTNLATGVTTTVTTNAQGLYSLPNLLPGNYQQTVSAAGSSIPPRTTSTNCSKASL